MSAADDVRVTEARRRLAALPHDTQLVLLSQAELVAWVARMHGAAQMLDAYVRDARAVGEDTPHTVREDTRRLNEIRALLAAFDWEYHDRQLALEAIERITEGGQS